MIQRWGVNLGPKRFSITVTQVVGNYDQEIRSFWLDKGAHLDVECEAILAGQTMQKLYGNA